MSQEIKFKANFDTELMLLLLCVGLVQWDGCYFEDKRLPVLIFGGFRVGTPSRWAVIRRLALI